MKILYLVMLYNGDINGGHSFRMATASALNKIVGDSNFDIVISELDSSDWACNVVMKMKSYSSPILKLRNLMQGNITQYSNKDIRRIVDLINRRKYDVVVFGSSETGKLIKQIKKRCSVLTITWYHDIIADVISNKRKHRFEVKMLPVWGAEVRAEGIDSRITDIPIVLHQRDAELLGKYWNRKPKAIIPIALEDKFVKTMIEDVNSKGPLILLFVGTYNWSPNTEAIRWFCENVMERIKNEDVRLCIAGFQMERLLECEWISSYKNVDVLGTIDDLNEVYDMADVVIEPIFEGSGMKVKTAEALMHGKEILGTEEALVGYDCLKDNICYCAEDFIDRIYEYLQNRPLRFVEENRSQYISNYSIECLKRKLKSVLDDFAECKRDDDING